MHATVLHTRNVSEQKINKSARKSKKQLNNSNHLKSAAAASLN